jgi:hypothetical protein
MSLEQNDFCEPFTYQEPILPDSLDNATAFFYALNALIRSTPSEICPTLTSNQPGFAARLFDGVRVSVRDIVEMAVGWIRRIGVAGPSTRKG